MHDTHLDPFRSKPRPCGVEWSLLMSQIEKLPILPASNRSFECHQDGGPVTETVHRARLAADDPACVGCPHGVSDSGKQFAFDGGNVRGLYLNTIDRRVVRSWCRSLAAQLMSDWNDGKRRPQVVVGHDERSSSPDLAVCLNEISLGGCDVIDIGRTLRPELDLAVRRAAADAGVMITGGHRPAGWTGIDVVGRGARSWSWPGRAEASMTSLATRQVRTAGSRTSAQIDSHYLEDLKSTAHGLRPMTGIILCQSALAALHCSELASAWPGQTLVDRVSQTEAVDIESTVRGFRYQGFPAFDFAAVLSADARNALFLDESGQPIPHVALATGLAELDGRAIANINGNRVDATTRIEEEVESATDGAWLIEPNGVSGVDAAGLRRRDGLWLVMQVVRRLSVSDLVASHVFVERPA